MGKYTVNDFKIGDEVYHLSNAKIVMVVIDINTAKSELSCRWIDNSGKRHSEEFLAAELGKYDDYKRSMSPRIVGIKI